jgi:hypothetical protein
MESGRQAAAIDVAEAAGSADPEVGLRAVAALRVLTERLEILQVDNARRLGWSWQDIAQRLGVTKQTVHRKHGRRPEPGRGGGGASALRAAVAETGEPGGA